MENNIKTNPQYKAVICPRCGSKNIEFATEYHKCIIARVLNLIVLIGLAYSIFYEIWKKFSDYEDSGFNTFALIVLIIALFIIQLYIYFTESKTHVQGVCRDCGNIWLLN